MPRRPIWVTDLEAETLRGFVAEILQKPEDLNAFEIKLLADLYARADVIATGKPDNHTNEKE